MGRFRSFIRHSAKPFAFALVAGIMSLSLIVTTPSNAHAWTLGDIKSPPRITAGVKDAISGVVSGVRTINPEVWRTAGTAATTAGKFGFRFLGGWVSVAMLAWDTRDAWYPYVAELWGQSNMTGAQPSTTAASGASISPVNLPIDFTRRLNGFDASMNYTGPDYTTGLAVSVVYRINCKTPQGATYQDWLTLNKAIGNGTYSAYPRKATFSAFCRQSVDTPTGIIVGPKNGDPLLGAPGATNPAPGPINVQHWGDLMGQGDPGFNPLDHLTRYKTTSECIDASGNKSSVSAESVGDDGALRVPSCAAAIPGSHATGNTKVQGLRPGGDPSKDWDTLWDTGGQTLTDPATPLCDPGRVGSGCELTVTKDGQPCTTGDPECENWAEQVKKDDATKNRYGCKFGPYVVPLSMCSMLEKAFFPGGAPATEENTDGDPGTRNDKDPNGQPIPQPAPPTVTTTTPGGEGAPEPNAEPSARQCFPTGWAAFNPVEWVLKPIRCAFEPTTDVKTRVATLRDTAKTKAPISWVMTDATGPGGAGCPDWTIHVGQASWSAVCGSSFTNAIVSSRGLIFTMLSVAMVWPLLRSLWYAAIPILRVTPSSGGK